MTGGELRFTRRGLWLLLVLSVSLTPMLSWLFSSVRVSQPQQPPQVSAKTPTEQVDSTDDANVLRVQVVDDGSGTPLDEVAVRFHLYGDHFIEWIETKTDAEGHCDLKLPVKRSVMSHITITAYARKRIPGIYKWDAISEGSAFPDSLTLRFKPGSVIGGKVQNELGEPIADCQITVHVFDTLDSVPFSPVRSANTDKQGRWQCDTLPRILDHIRFGFSHPDYVDIAYQSIPSLSVEQLREQNATFVMKRGATVEGRVTDSAGKPVVGAWLMVGFDSPGATAPQGHTDSNGRFRVAGCKKGESAVTVRTQEFAPKTKPVVINGSFDVGSIQLGPAVTLRGRVVDPQGNPLADADIALQRWGEHHVLSYFTKSDGQGRFEWNEAPEDEVTFSFEKPGYMHRYDVPVSASTPENTVVLDPNFVVRGQVVDAETKEPIERFDVIGTYPRADWGTIRWLSASDRRVAGESGNYEYSFRQKNEFYSLRIEAEGFLAVESKEIAYSSEPIELDFALTSVEPIQGRVLLRNGEPAGEAEIVVSEDGSWPDIRNGRVSESHRQAQIVKADSDGRFTFYPPGKGYRLIALHDSGYAIFDLGEEIPDEIQLWPWARIQGNVMIGDQPGRGETVYYRPTYAALWFPPNNRRIRMFFPAEAKCDEEGSFTLERVLPGPGTLSRLVTGEVPMFPGSSHEVPLNPTAEDTTEVTLGGVGRPVTGKIDLSNIGPEWRQSELACASSGGIFPWDRFTNYYGRMESDGTFRIDDLKAGRYSLRIDLHAAADPRDDIIQPQIIARVYHAFTIPQIAGGRSDQPLDLGTLAPTLP